MNWQPLILQLLRTGAGLLVVLAVAAVLWVLLAAVGDHAGASGARTVALVAAVCWALDFVALVVVLALNELVKSEVDHRKPEVRTPKAPSEN